MKNQKYRQSFYARKKKEKSKKQRRENEQR